MEERRKLPKLFPQTDRVNDPVVDPLTDTIPDTERMSYEYTVVIEPIELAALIAAVKLTPDPAATLHSTLDVDTNAVASHAEPPNRALVVGDH